MTSIYPAKDIWCHHTGFKKRCYDMVVKCKCRKWVAVQGNDPQTNAPLQLFDCADAWTPALQVMQHQRQLQTTASVDALRNEVQSANDAGMANALVGLNQQIRAAVDPKTLLSAHKASDPKLLEN